MEKETQIIAGGGFFGGLAYSLGSDLGHVIFLGVMFGGIIVLGVIVKTLFSKGEKENVQPSKNQDKEPVSRSRTDETEAESRPSEAE